MARSKMEMRAYHLRYLIDKIDAMITITDSHVKCGYLSEKAAEDSKAKFISARSDINEELKTLQSEIDAVESLTA